VQQTAYRFLDPALRETVLLEVGRALLERSSPGEVADKLFRIVGYLNGGAAQADDALRDRIVELDLAAAQRALVANAFADSVRLLRTALALLPADRWTSRYDQTVELHIKYMHALALLGDRAQEDELFELLRDNVRTPVHLGQIYELKLTLESSRGEYQVAIERGIAGLRVLGERLSARPGRLAALTELARTWRELGRIDPDELVDWPASPTEDAAASRLLVALSAPAYLTDANLLAIVMMRIVRRSLSFGMSEVSSHGFAGFGLIVSGLLGAYERARRYAMVAHQLDERFANPWLAPKVDLMSGIFIQPWTRPFEHCEAILARGAQVAVDNADLAYASYNATSRACLLYYRGAQLTAVTTAADAALRHTRRARDHDMETVVTTVLHAARCLRGETESPIDLSTAEHDDRAFMATLDERTAPIGAFFCRAIRCGVLYLHGRADLACELGRQAGAFESSALSNPSLAEYLFYYAMALLARWPELRGLERRSARRLIRRALKRFAAWSRHCPENFAARHALLEAEHARAVGRGQVLDRLNAALEAAVRHDRVPYEALAAELAASHCKAHGQTTMAELYLERAQRACQRWGATTKLQLLADRLAS
jgi:predicted ATPase